MPCGITRHANSAERPWQSVKLREGSCPQIRGALHANHDGNVFNVAIADVPERKKDLVTGRYELSAEATGAVIAVKVIDMLGEERIVLLKPEE